MENIGFDAWIKNLQEFSDEDKDKCKGIFCDIVEIALNVRKSGVLGTQEKITQLTDDIFLQNVMSSILSSTTTTHKPDGVELDKIREKTKDIAEKIQSEIMEGDYKGAELLKRILAIEGAISVYHGNSPTEISNYLNTFFGENYSP